jgi:hypothetical protein
MASVVKIPSEVPNGQGDFGLERRDPVNEIKSRGGFIVPIMELQQSVQSYPSLPGQALAGKSVGANDFPKDTSKEKRDESDICSRPHPASRRVVGAVSRYCAICKRATVNPAAETSGTTRVAKQKAVRDSLRA